jgi:hypothetical protein
MADSTSTLATLLLTTLQAAKEAAANALFNSASPSMLYANNPATTTGLTWGFIGGRYRSSAIANGTVALTASTTNYVVANATSGAVTSSTATTNWNNQVGFIRLYLVVTGASSITSYEDHRIGLVPLPAQAANKVLVVACTDETGAIAAATNLIRFRMPYAMTLTEVRASLSVAQASGSIFTVDINEGGASVLSTKLTVDNTEKSSVTAATPPVISDSSLADDAEISVDVDQIGDGSARGLKITLIGT